MVSMGRIKGGSRTFDRAEQAEEKPVGTVWFGLATPHGVTTYHRIFPGSRSDVRRASVEFALALLQQGAET